MLHLPYNIQIYTHFVKGPLIKRTFVAGQVEIAYMDSKNYLSALSQNY